MKGLISILGILISIGAAGQSLQDTVASDDRSKVSLEVTFGSAFSASKYGSSYGLYLSPRVAYPLTDRFTLRVGGIFRNYAPVSGFEHPAFYGSPFTSSYMQSLVMVEGAYRLNENITLTGAVYREIPTGNLQYPNRPMDIKGMIMGVDYQLNDNVFIRGQIEISNDRYPHHFSPLSHPYGQGFIDPFFRTP